LPLADALAPLASLKQFVLVRIDPTPKPGVPWKTNKVPLDSRTLFAGDSKDPANWLDASTAYAMAGALGPNYGVGFVITANDPVWCIDIDGCLQPDGTWSPVAQQLVQAFPGAAVELSDSRHGLHIWGCGRAPVHGKKNTQWGLEFYTELRMILLGRDAQASGSVATDHTAMLQHVAAAYFPPGIDRDQSDDDEWTTTPDPAWRGSKDDEELIRRANRQVSASSVFGDGASFADLWDCNIEKLARAFPSATGDAFDRSSADSALAIRLAFWTGRDCARIERLMRRSKLAREKWDDRYEYYLQGTIKRACRVQADVCQDRLPEEPPGPEIRDPSALPKPQRLGEQKTLLGPDDQEILFAGMTVVLSPLGVLVPGGKMRTPKQFDASLGGRSFVMDTSNSAVKKSAWEAITQSQLVRVQQADATTFRPDLPFGHIVNSGSNVYVNNYWPLDIPRKVGDPTPFLAHMEKLFPNERDRQIVLSYMAAIVQYPGVKFQWAPLIQGTQGNGKTTLSRCVAYAVGQQYTHWPKASKLSGQFNGWMRDKLFYAVEDIYAAGVASDEVMEELKPMITGEYLEIEGKGVDQITLNICGNFLFNTNHKAGLRKTRGDRRIAPFYTPQQEHGDLARDGMTPAYFIALRAWLEADGYAIVAELLHTMPIPPEFDPTKEAIRAPETSFTEEAIQHGMGRIEQEVMERVDAGMPGFAGGWISSHFFDQLLSSLGKSGALLPNRRRDLLKSLGYDWHPALKDGRVNNIVLPDSAKPRLFVRANHPALALTSAAEIARAYTAAQNSSTQEA